MKQVPFRVLSLSLNTVLESKLEQEKQALIAELRELKAKLEEVNSESNSQSVKEDSSKFSQQIKNHGFCENDDDSNGIVKEGNGTATLLLSPSSSSSIRFNGYRSSSDSLNHHWFQPFDSSMIIGNMYQSHIVKVEEQCVFTAEEPYNFLSVDQAPPLRWYFTEQLNQLSCRNHRALKVLAGGIK